jgi:putative transposase
MARLPRFFIPDVPQHIIQRGNNREPIFADRRDYLYYLDCLKKATECHGLYIHAYVLMTNHMHVLATPEKEESIPKVMQSLGRQYVQYFNFTYQRTGTLWEGRYRATMIDTEKYLLSCYRYIELNPVRAGMVVYPSEYQWSSYRCNAMGEKDTLIISHPKYLELGKDDQERQSCYRVLFQEPLAEKHLNDIREATNKAWVLGDDYFKKKIQALTERRVERLSRGRPKRRTV